MMRRSKSYDDHLHPAQGRGAAKARKHVERPLKSGAGPGAVAPRVIPGNSLPRVPDKQRSLAPCTVQAGWTAAMAATTASMLRLFSAAMQMRPESTP